MKTTNILYFLSIALLLAAFVLLVEAKTGRGAMIAGLLTSSGLAMNIFAFVLSRSQKA